MMKFYKTSILALIAAFGLQANAAGSPPKTMTGAFQSFYQDWVFNANGGEFLTWDVTIDINGTEATIGNFLNIAADGYSTQEDIKGTYDPAAKTITIPTPTAYESATKVGMIYNFTPAMLLCGTVTGEGLMTPDPQLVITLSDDGNTARIDQDFGAMQYSTDGSTTGFKSVYKGAVLKILNDDTPELVCFSKSVDLGKAYIGGTNTGSVNVFNLGKSATEVSTSCDGEAFKTEGDLLAIEAMSWIPVQVEFTPSALGAASGSLTIKEGARTFNVALSGEGLEPLDYSYLVKNGEMSFSTNPSLPFVKVEEDGVAKATSTKGTSSGDCSFLTVSFEVPEGHLGTLSWRGISNSEVSYATIPMIMADEMTEIGSYAGMLDKTIDDSYSFAAGYHSVSFKVVFNYPNSTGPKDGMTIYDLDFSTLPLVDDKANLITPELKFPNSLISDGATSKSAVCSIRNEGANPLSVTEIRNSTHFAAELPGTTAETLQSLSIPVTFQASEAGQFDETITLVTSAGEFPVKCSALVRTMPDFQQIVKEGDFTFETDEQHPFLIKDGRAYNSTAKEPDTEVTHCSFTARFNVPQGKMGRLNWKGRISNGNPDEKGWTDYLNIQIQTTYRQDNLIVAGEYDLDTKYFPYFEAPDAAMLYCGAGDCYITFNYIQYGDSKYNGEDLVEIYDLALTLSDDDGSHVVLNTPEVVFNDIYEGKATTAKVSFYNAGTEPFEIFDISGDENFYANVPEYTTPTRSYAEIPVYFTPASDGNYEASLIFDTSAGEFEVTCIGKALSSKGLLLIEDFEDDAANWTLYDRDGDGDAWNLAYNVYGGFTQGRTHSGEECLVSFSWDYVSGTFNPDNWTFSPAFDVPEDGAIASWWSSGDDDDRPGDVYSVYVAEGERDPEQMIKLDDYSRIHTETITSKEWVNRKVDISQYAGKRVHLAFRHHDCSGCYLVRIDDVYVFTKDYNSVESAMAEKTVQATILTSIDGNRLNAMPEKGLVIVTTIYSDGSSTSRKIIR